MKRKLTAGQTSVSLPIFVQDTSSTTGGGLSGLTSGTSGLVAEYRRRGQSSWTAITLTSKTLGTWTSGGIVADGALAGAYELDLPDAVCASGARWVAVRLRGAANMLPCLIEIELDACDYQVDALGAVKPTTAGRTLTVDTSGNVVLQDGSLTAIKIATDAITAAKIAADAVAEIQSGLASQTSVDTLTTYIDTEVAAIKAKTDNLPADPADASDIAAAFGTVNSTLVTIAGYIDTEVAAIKAKTDNLPADPADASDIAAAIAAIPTSAAIADAVWDEEMAGHTTAGTYGGRIVRATNSNVSVQITGSNHISADVHAFQTDVIDATAFASSAVTEIQSGLATAAELAKVPKSGETRRYTQVAANEGNKTADVSIGTPL